MNMNNDEFMKKAFEQARELQEKIAEAIGNSDKLRETIMEHARRGADATHEQTKAALDNLEAAMKHGSESVADFLKKSGF
jgi:hypothetical protein